MAFSRFGLQLGLRLFVILLTLALIGFLVVTPGYQVIMLLSLTVAAALTIEVVRFVSRTNQEVARFLNTARYGDFGQRFELAGLGAGFKELGDTFTQILDGIREERKQQEQELRHVKALLEHVPVPLLSVHPNGEVSLWNNSARRLFGRNQIDRLKDLEPFGAELPRQMTTLQPGTQRLVKFAVDGVEQSLAMSVSEIAVASTTERLVSLQNIQSELDATQIAAWRDLVRVLTHEIMNSITPVSSLAKTARDLLEDVGGRIADEPQLVAELGDVKDAVDTVARRSDGLMSFVESYRQLTHLPEPERNRFSVRELLDDVSRMAAVSWEARGIRLTTSIVPEALALVADRRMVEQVLLNLLKNCEHALSGTSPAEVQLDARMNARGGVIIEVTDNGPGVPDGQSERVFVPFYTTRREGSGVGLAFSRQVMIAHGGSIVLSRPASGGARFSLSF